ncbi:EthD domain-containing protein [Aspergillus pseudoustus]|uniref:EthD domain-containing protein n=1 Tax=Aspergillus pseudoustus TaxID=1810923 RepID=A0ABR4KDJ3_9EURO
MSSTPYTFAIFVTRKADISPTEFRTHWETNHIPILQRLGGPNFPLSHTRHYLSRDETLPGFPVSPIIVGSEGDFRYDAFAVVTFASEAAFQAFLPVMSSPEVVEDENRFTDRGKLRVVALGQIRRTNTGEN